MSDLAAVLLLVSGGGAVLGRAAAAALKMAIGIVLIVGSLFLALRGS